jgi:RNA polymerase sigma-70 factor (ECF subfamily)
MQADMQEERVPAARVRFAAIVRVPFDMMPLDIPRPNVATRPISRRTEPDVGWDDTHPLFEDAYKDNWLPVFRFALAWTNDWAAAEDLAQESFVRLWGRRHEVDWVRPVLPWLLVATRRLATDRFRRVRRALALRGPAESPPDADANLEWLDVSAGFTLLSPLERTALVLTAVQDLDAESAGAILGIGANAVRAAASRGRRKLKERR